jgi:hypothetical protein
MKKFIVYFLFVLNSAIFSESLSPLYIIFGSSQLIYSHCSLIPFQTFFPSSCDLLLNSNEKSFELRHSSLFSLGNNGFAFGYKKSSDGFHSISTGYGIKNERASFGSSLQTIVIKNDPILKLNVSSSLHLNKHIEKCILSINNITLIQNEKFSPDILLDFYGKIIDVPELYYSASLLSNLIADSIYNSPLSCKIDVSGKLGNRSHFIYSLGYQCEYVHNFLLNSINFSLGSMAAILEKGVGLMFGYSMNLKTKVNTVQCNLSFNPFQYRDITAPFVSMNITCSEYNNIGCYFSLKCNDYNGSGLKSWTLIISDLASKNGKIIKIFSGGFPAPTTVFWDKKDSRGVFLDSLVVFSRLVGIDNSNNVGYTPWIPVNSNKK